MTPRPVTPSRSVKLFTLDEANRSLALVRRIVGDIVKTQQRGNELEAELVEAGAKMRPAMQKELDHLAERFTAFVDELGRIGVQLKDPRIGLIDFISRHQGRDICLCWKLGEDQIEYWHETAAGYAGRQPVGTLSESAV